jgi:hypothetical protein
VGPVLDLTVRSVDQDASRTLSEAALSAAAGGMIQVRSMQGTLYPERPVYRVVLDVVTPLETDAVLQHRWRGKVSIRGQWEAAAAQFVKTATSVFGGSRFLASMNDCNGRRFNRSMHPPRSSLWPYSLVAWSFTERKSGDLPILPAAAKSGG